MSHGRSIPSYLDFSLYHESESWFQIFIPAESYITLAMADSRSGLMPENNKKQQKHHFQIDYDILLHLISSKYFMERDDS